MPTKKRSLPSPRLAGHFESLADRHACSEAETQTRLE